MSSSNSSFWLYIVLNRLIAPLGSVMSCIFSILWLIFSCLVSSFLFCFSSFLYFLFILSNFFFCFMFLFLVFSLLLIVLVFPLLYSLIWFISFWFSFIFVSSVLIRLSSLFIFFCRICRDGFWLCGICRVGVLFLFFLLLLDMLDGYLLLVLFWVFLLMNVLERFPY